MKYYIADKNDDYVGRIHTITIATKKNPSIQNYIHSLTSTEYKTAVSTGKVNILFLMFSPGFQVMDSFVSFSNLFSSLLSNETVRFHEKEEKCAVWFGRALVSQPP